MSSHEAVVPSMCRSRVGNRSRRSASGRTANGRRPSCRGWPTSRCDLAPSVSQSVRDPCALGRPRGVCKGHQRSTNMAIQLGCLANAQVAGWANLNSQCGARRIESVHLHRDQGLRTPCCECDRMAGPLRCCLLSGCGRQPADRNGEQVACEHRSVATLLRRGVRRIFGIRLTSSGPPGCRYAILVRCG